MSITNLQREQFQKLLKSERVKNGHNIIRAVAGLTRYRIITLLNINPNGLTVSDLASIFSASPSKISHQLRVLKNYNLVFGKREGQTILYRMHADKIKPFLS